MLRNYHFLALNQTSLDLLLALDVILPCLRQTSLGKSRSDDSMSNYYISLLNTAPDLTSPLPSRSDVSTSNGSIQSNAVVSDSPNSDSEEEWKWQLNLQDL